MAQPDVPHHIDEPIQALPVVIRANDYAILNDSDDGDPLKQYEQQLQELKVNKLNESRISTTLQNQLDWASRTPGANIDPQTAVHKAQSDQMVITYEDAITATMEKITNIKALQDAHKNILPSPNFIITTTDANGRQHHRQKEDIPRLDYNDMKTIPRMTSTNNVDITEVIKKLVNHSDEANWGEGNFRTALGKVLAGDHFETFDTHQNKPVHEILEILARTYASGQTMPERQSRLDSFRRKDGETITQAMARYETLLTKVEIAYPVLRRKAIKEAKMENTLESICSKEALITIRKKKQQALQRGTHLEFEDILKIATDNELNNGYHHSAVTAYPAITTPANLGRESRRRSASPYDINRPKSITRQPSSDLFNISTTPPRFQTPPASSSPKTPSGIQQSGFKRNRDGFQRSISRSPTRYSDNSARQNKASQHARQAAYNNGERQQRTSSPAYLSQSSIQQLQHNRLITDSGQTHNPSPYQSIHQSQPSGHRNNGSHQSRQQFRTPRNNQGSPNHSHPSSSQNYSGNYQTAQSQPPYNYLPSGQDWKITPHQPSYNHQRHPDWRTISQQPQQSQPRYNNNQRDNGSWNPQPFNRTNYRGKHYDPRKDRGAHRLDQSIVFHGPPQFQQNWTAQQTRAYNVQLSQTSPVSKNQLGPRPRAARQ